MREHNFVTASLTAAPQDGEKRLFLIAAVQLQA
jgi:hypothetical protein